jgi:hypothetical protein
MNKEIPYGKGKKEEIQNRKSKETGRLYMFKLRQSYQDPLTSLFTDKSRPGICMPVLRSFYRRSPARLRPNVDRNEIRMQELRQSYTIQRSSMPAKSNSIVIYAPINPVQDKLWGRE